MCDLGQCVQLLYDVQVLLVPSPAWVHRLWKILKNKSRTVAIKIPYKDVFTQSQSYV